MKIIFKFVFDSLLYHPFLIHIIGEACEKTSHRYNFIITVRNITVIFHHVITSITLVGAGVTVLVGAGVTVLVGAGVIVLVGAGVTVLVGAGVTVLVGAGVTVTGWCWSHRTGWCWSHRNGVPHHIETFLGDLRFIMVDFYPNCICNNNEELL